MKKIIALLLAAMMVFCLAACGSGEKNGEADVVSSEDALEKIRTADIGDTVYFGSFEQDNDLTNGKEAIEWLVLSRESGKVLVVSKFALDCQDFDTPCTSRTWDGCTLRAWMNETFCSEAFSEEELAMIAWTTVTADGNPDYPTDPGYDTNDRIFSLSIEEATRYFSSASARACSPTAYASANGAISFEDGAYWWLRTPGFIEGMRAAFSSSDGYIDSYGNGVGDTIGTPGFCARPAMWITLD